MNRFFILDCNNFFVSCERVFNPALRNKPVVVLSSGDACIIARSNEAKALGIAMGIPLFKVETLLKKNNAAIFSANFSLYNDLSNRIMQIITSLATDIEIYSIDEAFFFVSDHNVSIKYDPRFYYTIYAHQIAKTVKQNTGIPVSIGIGPTKTLAKIANRWAKKNLEYGGVFDISEYKEINQLLASIAIEDVWGIGYRYCKKLKNKNIKTAYDFKNLDDAWVRKHMSIVGLKTLHELRGISCFPLDESPDSKKSITVSRVFGNKTSMFDSVKEAVASYMSTAAQKLRSQKSLASGVTVFLLTSKYHDPQNYFKSNYKELTVATDYTPDLIKAAHKLVHDLFIPELCYKKVGVMLTQLVDQNSKQLDLQVSANDNEKKTKCMKAIDAINTTWGKDTLFFAAIGIKQQWKMKQNRKSPCYTTNWKELLTIDVT